METRSRAAPTRTSAFPPTLRRGFGVLVLALAVAGAACTSGDSAPPPDSSPDAASPAPTAASTTVATTFAEDAGETTTSLQPIPAGRFIATVTDEWGRPVTGAEVEGSRSTVDGIAAGIAPNDDWYTVAASGYAPVMVQGTVGDSGYAVVEVALQPVSSAVVLEPTDIATLTSGGVATAQASLDLAPGVFGEVPVLVEFTELRRPPASMLHAPVINGDGLYPSRVFSISASDGDHGEVSPVIPAHLSVFDDGALPDDAPLAFFDRSTGSWTVEDRCTRTGNQLECPLTHFSHHAVLSPEPTTPSPATPGEDQSYQDSRAAVEDAEAAGADIPLDELRHMIEAAELQAERNPSEIAKQRLIGAQLYANDHLPGEYDLGPLITSVYNTLAEELAATVAAAEDPCPLWPQLVAMIEEAALLDFLKLAPSGVDTVRRLIGEVELACRLFWEGEIVFTFPPPQGWEIYNTIPPTDFALQGDATWTERISVRFTAPNGEVTGTASSRAGFTYPVLYVWDSQDASCGDDWQELEVRARTEGAEPMAYVATWRGTGDPDEPFEPEPVPVYPPPNRVTMEFTGSYDEPTFQVSGMRRTDGGAPVIVETTMRTSQWFAPCEHAWLETLLEDSSWTFESMLLDGFGPLNPHSPVLTMNDILNGDRRVLDDGTIVISGRRALEFTLDLVVPFPEAIVTWDIRTVRLPWVTS